MIPLRFGSTITRFSSCTSTQRADYLRRQFSIFFDEVNKKNDQTIYSIKNTTPQFVRTLVTNEDLQGRENSVGAQKTKPEMAEGDESIRDDVTTAEETKRVKNDADKNGSIIDYENLDSDGLVKTQADPLRALIEEKGKAFRELEKVKRRQEEILYEHKNVTKDSQKSKKELFERLQATLGYLLNDQRKLNDQVNDLSLAIDARKKKQKSEIPESGGNAGNELQSIKIDLKSIKNTIDMYLRTKPLTYIHIQKKYIKDLYNRNTVKYSRLYSLQKQSLYKHIMMLSGLINDVTGYTNIGHIKTRIDNLEHQVLQSQSAVKLKKQKYSDTINTRTKTQKEINELLTRKHQWTPKDLENFTKLYREDHSADQRVKKAEQELEQAEVELETLRGQLVKEISNKYHEEYLWNIKMRGLSTWVTVGLMVLNIIILLLSQIIFEPLKVQRIVTRFEQRFDPKTLNLGIEGKIDEVNEIVAKLETKVSSQDQFIKGFAKIVTVNEINKSSKNYVFDLGRLKAMLYEVNGQLTQTCTRLAHSFKGKFSYDLVRRTFSSSQVSFADNSFYTRLPEIILAAGVVSTGLLIALVRVLS